MNTKSQRALAGNAPRDAAGVSKQQIEAARYVVLRRLTPSLRHHMVRPLQPIELIHGVMSHKLCDNAPDLQALRLQVEKINSFAKSALAECLDVGTWLSPEPGTLTRLGAGITECVGLMANMLNFCGFGLVCEGDAPPVSVSQDALRMVLTAAMFEMTDALSVPATLTLNTSVRGGEASLLLHFAPLADGEAGEGAGHVERYNDGYRNVTWDDVQALAAAGDVRVSRGGNGVAMHFAVRAAVDRLH